MLPSGKYKGLFSNDRMPGQWFETEMFLTIQFNGSLTGNGSDRTGRFSAQGRINGSQCVFSRNYGTHFVHFDGVIVGLPPQHRLKGRWRRSDNSQIGGQYDFGFVP